MIISLFISIHDTHLLLFNVIFMPRYVHPRGTGDHLECSPKTPLCRQGIHEEGALEGANKEKTSVFICSHCQLIMKIAATNADMTFSNP